MQASSTLSSRFLREQAIAEAKKADEEIARGNLAARCTACR
jgi:hypothetical protein